MPNPIGSLATAARDAIEGATLVEDAARALLEAAGPADYTRHVDVGVNLAIVILPGWGPLTINPGDFVRLSHEVS